MNTHLNSADDPRVFLEMEQKHQTKLPLLVLTAVGVPCLVRRFQSRYYLLVPPEFHPQAEEEWQAYLAENANWPPPESPPLSLEPAVNGTFGYILLILVLFGWQQKGMWGVDWVEVGAAHAQLIRDGHLWRCITALCLHADTGHALSNIFFGTLLGAGVAQRLGSARGWFMILSAGALGNLAAAWLRGGPHYRAIGASTAVFAALGILVALRIRERRLSQDPLYRTLAPLMAGVAMFAWFGMGEGPVDITAHATGLVCGGLVGWVLPQRLLSPGTWKNQAFWFAWLVFSLGVSWGIALTL